MDREKLFKEFLEECKKNNQICGAGNPYAQILKVKKNGRIIWMKIIGIVKPIILG